VCVCVCARMHMCVHVYMHCIVKNCLKDAPPQVRPTCTVPWFNLVLASLA